MCLLLTFWTFGKSAPLPWCPPPPTHTTSHHVAPYPAGTGPCFTDVRVPVQDLVLAIVRMVWYPKRPEAEKQGHRLKRGGGGGGQPLKPCNCSPPPRSAPGYNLICQI